MIKSCKFIVYIYYVLPYIHLLHSVDKHLKFASCSTLGISIFTKQL